MKILQKKLDDNRLRFEIEATAKEVDKAFNQAQSIFAQQMNLQPQQGKTIAQVAEGQLGIKDLDAVVKTQVVDCLTPFALDDKDVVPAFLPQVVSNSQPKRGEGMNIVFEVTPKPQYELTSYDPVSITIQPFEINEQEIDMQLAQMAEQYAEFVSDDPHPVNQGDSILISMSATQDGEAVSGLTIDARTYPMNQGLMPHSFDENLLGMDVGEEKSFTFSGPTIDEQGNESEQEVEATVKVLEIQKKIIPAINDAWVAKNMPMFKSEAALRGALRDQLTASYKDQYEAYKRQMAASELAKRFEGRIDDAIYEAMRDSLMNDLQMRLQQQGITMDQYIQQSGGEQQFSMMLMMQTRQNIIEGFSLDALFRHEKMTLSEQDLYDAAKTMNPQNPEMAKRGMEDSGYGFALREAAARIKANKWLVEHANITVEKPA